MASSTGEAPESKGTHQYQPRDFKVVGTTPLRPDGVDKVTGRARFGADMNLPGQLVGKVLRSPHPHAKLVSIDTSEAEALSGVKAVVTRDDFAENEAHHDILCNIMARDKVLYEGHAVAAVAATSRAIALKALKKIKVVYDILPHVTDVDEAMKADAPILHDDMFTHGVDPMPTTASNIAGRCEFGHGDVDAGFEQADIIIERSFKTAATHQGYIEPHACVATVTSDGYGELWGCTQGHFVLRNVSASLVGMDVSKLRVTASEIGGGFGGKTTVFLEPVCLMLAKKSGKPVKMAMTRDEVFKASGPTASSSMDVKIGCTKDGRITAGFAEVRYQGGAFRGAPADFGAMCAFACYALENVKAVGWEVVTNRPKGAAYRAPGAPMSVYAVESVVDELAKAIDMDPIDFRLKNAARNGDKSSYGPKFESLGLVETLEAAKNHPNYQIPLGPNQGRGVASGFWFNFGGETCSTLNVNQDGTVAISVGTPDIGGSRASMCQMAAEELGIPYDQVRAIVTDTSSLGFNDTTEGSRVTFSSGMAVIFAAREIIGKLCERAAMMWDIPVEAVKWEEGKAIPAGANAGDFEPLTLAEIADAAGGTGGPIAGHHEYNADGAGVSFGTHLVDTEVDPETGFVKILRYTVIQDAGKAIHPSYVEGQFQGGAVQGIGWALNEEYIYGDDGKLQNAGFLDYRLPVASDLPMIDTVIVEVPNPGHPYGVRGVGETGIVPPLAAIANSVSDAANVRMTELPMSPPRILKAIHQAEAAE
ncbi:xanthine dehydrogenase family protein molybdopterin-binding subunit [Curvivirga sp.]|uniref:xanthine dehydrogenase family protein molybdopterin-binding subunit n=1 Tax=Curvivirga sp. TaxID=2856848 RepID=UPI003B5B8CB8